MGFKTFASDQFKLAFRVWFAEFFTKLAITAVVLGLGLGATLLYFAIKH